VALWAVLTAAMVATNAALVAPAGTVTDDGAVTALLLLTRPTVTPPLPAAALKVTAQESVVEPARELLAQLNPFSTGRLGFVPVPLRFTTRVPLLDALLAIVSCPDAGPGAAGLNWTLIPAVCPGANVTGTFPPETANPDPATAAALTVTGSVPVDVRVTDSAAAVPTVTLPNDKLEVLMLSPGVTAFNCRENDCEVPLSLAERVTVSGEVTAATVAAKPALVAPAATCTEAGTLTAPLLLVKFTVTPPLGAAALKVTVQLSDAAPVIVPVAHVNAIGPGMLAATPMPLRLITIASEPALPLAIVSCPLAGPALFGEKPTPSCTVAPAASVIGKSAVPLTENDCPVTVTFETCTADEP
jgi:hypothetical protein